MNASSAKREVVLASASPRRREICALAGIAAEMIPASAEIAPDGTLPIPQAVRLVARAKAEEVAPRCPGRVVVGADTVVVAPDGRTLLGKPRDAEDAARMLRLLGGRTHTVYTGVWVCAPRGGVGFTKAARVRFYPLEEAEIAAYVATGEPLDKAGGYGIQGLGMRLVAGIAGDFYTVMGLPGAALARVLRRMEVCG